MKHYTISVMWDRNGNRYPMCDELRVTAGSVRAAIGKALAPEYRKARKGWREPQGATFTIRARVLGPAEIKTDA